jgi:putative DNA primase/helicase
MFDAQDIVNAAINNPLTEHALALHFSERHAHDLRYVALKNQWFQWDGMRWGPENTFRAFDLARKSIAEDVERYAIGKPPDRLQAAKTVVGVITLARADRRQAATVEQFDADPFLLNTHEGIVDLRTGLFGPADPKAYMTRLAGIGSSGGCPLWLRFLAHVTRENPELIGFLQRYLGYCLTGDVSEHRFVFAYGTGANGKSTLVNTVVKILGDYATIADVGTFLASNHERHPTDIAKLHGARFVAAQETERGRKWDESKIKTMTGGDKMTARFMRQDFFDFVPSFKLFIVGNNKPRLDNVDEAMRRRLLLVPFTVQIVPSERDLSLPAKLVGEGPAILRWMIEGCLEWQRIGLAPPAVVTDATNTYFDDQDVIGQWLAECTEDGGPFAFTPIGQLYASWKNWCGDRGMPPGTAHSFSDALVDRGHERKRAHGGKRGFAKLVVRDQQGESDRFG